MDDIRARTPLPRLGRPSKSEPFRIFVASLLAHDPSIRSAEILRRAAAAGYGGGKSALYDLIAALRPSRTPAPHLRELRPGEACEHDLTPVRIHLTDDRTVGAYLLTSRLRYAGWSQATLLDEPGVESVIRALAEHYARQGGVPLLAVLRGIDAVAAAGRHDDGRVSDWVPAFAQAALDLGIAIEALPPQSSASACDGLGARISAQFFDRRRFVTPAEAAEQLAAWVRALNSDGDAATRLADERHHLRPLKFTPGELAVRLPVVVGPEGAVEHDGRRFPVAAEARGRMGTLFLYRDRVRIVAGGVEAIFARRAPECPRDSG